MVHQELAEQQVQQEHQVNLGLQELTVLQELAELQVQMVQVEHQVHLVQMVLQD